MTETKKIHAYYIWSNRNKHMKIQANKTIFYVPQKGFLNLK